MATNITFHKVTQLPAVLEPNAVYFVGPAGSAARLELYATNTAGSAARGVLTESEIQTMIDSAIAAAGQASVVSTFADLPASGAVEGDYTFVVDASGDPTVGAGGATYIFDGSAWVKVSEAESMDLTLAWSAIVGGPTSSPASIDSAVTAAHTHLNKTTLDQFDVDQDGLKFGNDYIALGWVSNNW